MGRSLPTLMPPTSTVTVFFRLAKLMVGEIYHGGSRVTLVGGHWLGHNRPSDIRSMPNHLRAAQKVQHARRRPSAAREAYSLYVERAAEEANEADGLFSDPPSEASMLTVETPQDLKKHIGKTLGPSDWLVVDQAMIDKFAEATGDHQWIHVDVERAKKEMPGGKTIAHGYLTLCRCCRGWCPSS